LPIYNTRERDIGIGRERVILKKLEGEEVLSEIEEGREREMGKSSNIVFDRIKEERQMLSFFKIFQRADLSSDCMVTLFLISLFEKWESFSSFC